MSDKKPTTMESFQLIGDPNNSVPDIISVLVYKSEGRENKGRKACCFWDVNENVTLQDIYNHKDVLDGPRLWDQERLAALKAGDKKIVITLTNKEGTEEYMVKNATKLDDVTTAQLVKVLPRQALQPVHFLLDIVDNDEGTPNGGRKMCFLKGNGNVVRG